MFINTRNFFLYLLSVAFLIIAITVTLTSNQKKETNELTRVDNSAVLAEEVIYSGEVSHKNDLDRVAKVLAMKQKISELGISETLTAALPDPTEVEESVTEESVVTLDSPLLCSNYSESNKSWSAVGVKIEVVEGARLIFREQTNPAPTSGSSTMPLLSKEVLLQLPLSALPGVGQNCLPSDVIGVATDGSLMRNTEKSLYGIFSADTLLGYALDGFPIYGQSETTTDSCGGAVVTGQYRYFISEARETLINCFAGSPASW
jgi:hypothetical protein